MKEIFKLPKYSSEHSLLQEIYVTERLVMHDQKWVESVRTSISRNQPSTFEGAQEFSLQPDSDTTTFAGQPKRMVEPSIIINKP